MDSMIGAATVTAPCSYAQRWLLALDSMLADPAEYHVNQAVVVAARLDEARLQSAVDSLVARHQILRTRYAEVAGVSHAVLASGSEHVRLVVVDDVPDLTAARRVITEQIGHPFDLRTDLPIRVILLRLPGDRSVVALVAHHIAVDAWSLSILWRELGSAYDGADLGEPPPDYADVASPEPVTDDDQLQFWADVLAEPAWADLPSDRPRTATRSGRGGHLSMPVPAALYRAAHQLAVDENSSLFSVLLAAMHIVLARWTGAEQTSLGTVVSGRIDPQLESVVGFFVNTVVLRQRVRPESKVRDFLRQVRDDSLDAYSNGEVSFAELVVRHDAGRSPGRSPLFSVMATMQDDTPGEFRPAGARSHTLELPSTTSKFDLSVSFTQLEDGLAVELSFASDLFEAATISRFGHHLLTVLEGICRLPEARVADLPMMTAGEEADLLAQAQTPAEPLDRLSLAEAFRATARHQPHADAVRLGSRRLSYADLDWQSELLARSLRQRGINRGDRVGLRVGRTPELFVAMLAILKAGGCYVAVDPNAPAERSRLVLADSGARLVLTDADLSDPGIATDDAPVVLEPCSGPDDLAYVMYTSGSTGKPKGVLITQQGVLNLSRDMIARLRLGPGDTVAAVAPHSFDMSVPELITPLLAGACIRLIPRSAAVDASMLAAELADVTFAQLTPSHWQLLLEHGWSAPELRAGCGAEQFPPALAGRLRAAVGELWNFYGPTETTVWSTAAKVTDTSDGRSVPIGHPMRNTFAIVLDSELRPVPVGVPGELFLGGPGLALGYNNAPALTAASFVPDEFHPGQRLYRTGDVVRRLPGGQLEFNVRADHQVKVRGFRIELAEVEAALERHPDVVRAAATVLGQDADRMLAGFVVLRAGAGRDENTAIAEIRAFAGRLLPSYMVPAVLQLIESLPLSSNGKLDRRQLPQDLRWPAHSSVAPRTAAERAVADAFARVLGVGDLGAADDFFALGGHSLNGSQVVAILRESFPAASVRMLFDRPSVGGLAEALSAAQHDPSPDGKPVVDGSADPVSSAQRRLWLLHQLSAEPAEYNVQRVLRLTGPLDADRLADALAALHQRHSALRSTFASENGHPRLVPHEESFQLARTVVNGDVETALHLAQTDIDQPFELATGPLWRARLITLSDEEHLVVLVFHHIVIDGGSFPVLWRELASLYRGAELLPPAPRYRGPARVATGELSAGLRFWQEHLAGAPTTELPADRPRPLRRSGRGATHRFNLDAHSVTGLHDLARALGTTYFVVGMAAFAAVLARFTDSSEVIVGTPVSGRADAEAERTVGCFVNTIVLRLSCSGDDPFTDLVRRVGATTATCFGNGSVPFEEVVEAVDPARDLSRNPIFQVMFASPGEESVQLPGLACELLDTPATTSKFDLAVDFSVTGEASLIYDTDLFDPATIEGFAGVYAELLRAAAAVPHTLVGDLGRSAGQPLPAPAGRAVPLPHLLDSVAFRHPHQIALEAGGARLSFRELAVRIEELAAALAARGVRRGSVVALTVPAGTELALATLAVSRLGAAFLPLNPADPPARRQDQLRIGRADLELTELPPPVRRTGALPLPDLDPDDLAAVYFTSGSTGRPKAVLERHGGLAHYLQYLHRVIGVGTDDTVLQLAPPTFDASLRDTFGALSTGGRTVLLPVEARRDAYQILAAIQRHRVTALLSVVPAMLRALVRAARGDSVDLRLVLVSGEVLDAGLADEVRRWAPKARLINQYGPTECTMTSTYHEVLDADLQAGMIPIGRPLPTTSAHVLDRDGRPQPDGALGELCLGGAGLARGYDTASLTARRFAPDPFGPSGSRLFHTGDLVHRRHDGVLCFHGRNDNQIKIRGVRIEPAEIEVVLSRCAGVEASAVVLRDGDLIAYLTGNWDPAEVKRELANVLPPLLHPTHLQRLDSLPLNTNGKLDRARLPEPVIADRVSGQRPRDTAELMMTEAWQQVLDRSPIGVQDDFFQIGGNSLRAVELVELLRARYDLALPLHLLFSHPTVEKLCTELPSWHSGTRSLAIRLAAGDPARPPLFLIHPQSGEVCSYLDLVRGLPPDLPVYVVEAVGYSTDEVPLDRIEAMAERYLHDIRAVAPQGPYRLGGWSFGANVAFEIAHQLERQGEQVSLLAVIDARAFGQDAQEDWYLDLDEATKFAMVAGVPEDRTDEISHLDDQSVLGLLLAHARDQGKVSGRADSATMRRMVEVFSANGRAAESYRTTARIHAPVLLFKSTERHPTLTNPKVDPAAWQGRTSGPLTVQAVPGTHHDVIDAEHAAGVASQLAAALSAEGPC